jgi:hypothetical protein
VADRKVGRGSPPTSRTAWVVADPGRTAIEQAGNGLRARRSVGYSLTRDFHRAMRDDPSELTRWISEQVDSYLDNYELPEPGTTVGIPWSREKVATELARMRTCIVDPYVATFLFHDTIEQINADPQIRKQCWVVAEDGVYRLLLDPDTKDFVLAEKGITGEWVTIGVRGDPVGTFISR